MRNNANFKNSPNNNIWKDYVDFTQNPVNSRTSKSIGIIISANGCKCSRKQHNHTPINISFFNRYNQLIATGGQASNFLHFNSRYAITP
eukprot:12245377-Ditylum_brightwellii.AAC.1